MEGTLKFDRKARDMLRYAMSSISITMEGADALHRHRIRRKQARVLLFPDGIKRVISMSVWHWETFDRLKEEMWFTDEEFAACAFFGAKEFAKPGSDFEQEIRKHCKSRIRTWSEEEDRLANDN